MNEPTPTDRAQVGRIALLSSGHVITDAYAAFLAGLSPVLKSGLGLTNAAYGTLITIFSLTCNFSQPLWGYLSDRLGRRWLVTLGPIVAGLFMTYLLRANRYGIVAVCVLAAGVGVAMFHPIAAAMMGKVSGARRGLAMGALSAGGALGFATGPLLALMAYKHLPGATAWLTVLPGLLMAAALQCWAPPLPAAARRAGDTRRALLAAWRPLALVMLVVAARAGAIICFHAFLPLMLCDEGWTHEQAAQAQLVFVLSGALVGLPGGYLSDRLGRRATTVVTLLASAPALLMFLQAEGLAAWAWLALAGGLAGAAVPVNIVMAQEIVPTRAGIASSLAMGGAWGLGGFLATPVGHLADLTNYREALTLVAFLPVIGALLCLPLRPPANSGEEEGGPE